MGEYQGQTSEAGGTAEFTVELSAPPTDLVEVALSSSDPGEGDVVPAALRFDGANWAGRQTVTVTGVDDHLADGPVDYQIHLTPSGGFAAQILTFTNQDDDSPGFTLGAISGNTTEAGGRASFTVRLGCQPTAAVAFDLSVSDPTEGQVSPASLSFTAENWDQDQTVWVSGVDDAEKDGDVAYQVRLGTARSDDAGYAGLDPEDVDLKNLDDDEPGLWFDAMSGTTTEAGGQATFKVRLQLQPAAQVRVPLSVSDVSEASLNPSSLTFEPADWDQPQTITLTGLDDSLPDGNVAYRLVVGPLQSDDPLYQGLNPGGPELTNQDNDSAGFALSAPDGHTSETGGTARFTVALTAQPIAPVTLPLSSSDPGEGTLSQSSLTFTAADWDQAQTVEAVGQQDTVADGNQTYWARTGPATSSDPAYSGLNPADVEIVNLDDETAGFIRGAISGNTSESGTTATFTLRLSAQPSGEVNVPLASSDATEGSVSPAALLFDQSNWNQDRTVTVTGLADGIADGDQAYRVLIGPATGAGAYHGVDPADVDLINTEP